MSARGNNPGKGAFKRCVREVAASGGAADPRAVCAAAGRKKYGAAEFARMAAAGRRRVASNPGEMELDTAKAAQQYKRLIEAEGATGVRISRRGRKHLVRWNPKASGVNRKIRRAKKAGHAAKAKHYAAASYKRAYQTPGRGLHTNKPKNKKKIPKKVLDAHRRIWGGKIPAGAMELLRKEFVKNPGRVRQNNLEAAAEKFEEFHGRPVQEWVEVKTPLHVHDVLSGLGTLVKMVILTPNGHWRVTIKGFKGTLLAQNEDSENMPQLYLEGGDQGVNLADFGIKDPIHEFEELGRMQWVYYHTVKDHLGDDGGDATYKHKLRKIRGGGQGREKPVVIYDVRNKLITIAGGAYTILPEGIEN